MMEFLRKLFGRRPEPPDGSEYVDETERGKLYQRMQKQCPDCSLKPPQYMEGPIGGMSVNVFCARCGSGFNVTPMIEIAERIGHNPRYISSEYLK